MRRATPFAGEKINRDPKRGGNDDGNQQVMQRMAQVAQEMAAIMRGHKCKQGVAHGTSQEHCAEETIAGEIKRTRHQQKPRGWKRRRRYGGNENGAEVPMLNGATHLL